MMFGYDIPETTDCWGARAIYKGYSDDYLIDLLPDRVSVRGNADNLKANGFETWLFQRALPLLREMLREKDIQNNSSEILTIQEFNFILKATPNRSYGYLYIGAGILPIIEAEPHFNEIAKRNERVLVVGDKKLVWGVDWDIPPVGTQGEVTVNGIGKGTVVGYYEEKYADGLLLLVLRVKLDKPPKWWKEQTYQRAVEEASKAGRPKPKKTGFVYPPAFIFDGDFRYESLQKA